MKNATPGKDWGVGGLAQGGVGVGSLFSGGGAGMGNSLLLVFHKSFIYRLLL